MLQKVFGEDGGEFFDGVGLVAVGDEEGVFGLDDDEVIDPEESDVRIFAIVEDDVVFGVDLGDGGIGGVLDALLGEVFGDGDPGSDVIPIERGFEVEDAFGFFHEGVVDGDGGECGKLGRDGGGDIAGVAELGNKVGKLWALPSEFTGDGGDGPNKHASIPGEAALGEELLGEVGAGLFAEAFDFEREIFAIYSVDGGAFAAFDVAVGGAGPGGFDADGDESIAMGGDGDGIAHDGLVGRCVGDQLIGGEDHHDSLGIAGGDDADAEGYGWCGVALGGLGNDVFGGEHGGELAYGGDLFFVGKDEDVLERNEAVESIDGLGEEGAAVEEIEKLFRFMIAAERPEAGA